MPDRPALPTIRELARSLAEGATTSEALVEAALERIAAHRAGGGAAYVGEVDALAARLAARASDLARAAGHVPSPLAGLPVSVKDLFDVRGQVTRAGSAVLADAGPAPSDAAAVARLRAAGAVLLGRTNMSEFAFSGLGLNPPPRHAGASTGCRPGHGWIQLRRGGHGSAGPGRCGAGYGHGRLHPHSVGVLRAHGLQADRTAGAARGRVSASRSLDSVGPLARSVDCCAILDAVLSGEGSDAAPAGAWPLAGMRLGVVQDLVMDGLEPEVAAAFEDALRRLSAAGARIERVAFAELHALPRINAAGGLIAAEAWQVHRARLVDASVAARYDPRVAQRTRRGDAILAADYIDVQDARVRLQAAAQERLGHLDAWLMPTVAGACARARAAGAGRRPLLRDQRPGAAQYLGDQFPGRLRAVAALRGPGRTASGPVGGGAARRGCPHPAGGPRRGGVPARGLRAANTTD